MRTGGEETGAWSSVARTVVEGTSNMGGNRGNIRERNELLYEKKERGGSWGQTIEHAFLPESQKGDSSYEVFARGLKTVGARESSNE